MKRRILVLFPDEWDLAAERDPHVAAAFEFFHEGFDLFRFPGNARLFTFDAFRFVDRLVAHYRTRAIDAVVTTDEQFGAFIAALVAEGLGLAHSPLAAVLNVQHKYYARAAFERIAPECNVRFGLLRRGYGREDIPLPFPFYVKPAKAAFSVLARRVDSYEELRGHTRFAPLERAIIERLVRPFADVMRERSELREHPFSMVAEEIALGRQVTVNGFAHDGEVTLFGTVDSFMYPGTDQFQRFQYPSSLAPAALASAEAAARRLVAGMGFSHGFFNVEMRVCPQTGEVRVIEINPRAAGQFFDLFERVDGFNAFEGMLDLACGRKPAVRRGEGVERHAASFVLREFSGRGLARAPSSRELAALRARHPGARVMVYPRRGAALAREYKWLGSYRYGVLNVGGGSLGEMFARFHRVCADMRFHPPGHRAANAFSATPAAGDD